MKITKQQLNKIIKEEAAAVLKEKEEPKYVRDDAYVAKHDPAFRKEVCLGRKRNGEFVDWFVRDGKGRCEHVTLDENGSLKANTDIDTLRQKLGLPAVSPPSDEEVQAALAGEERPITWDTIDEINRRIDALELKVYKGIDR